MTGTLIEIKTTSGSPFGEQYWTLDVQGEKKTFAMWEDYARWPKRGSTITVEPVGRQECHTGWGKIVLDSCARLVCNEANG